MIKSRFLLSFESHPPSKQELILEEDEQNNEKSMGDSRGQNTSIKDLYLEKNDEFNDIGFLQNIKTDPPLDIIKDTYPTPVFINESHIHPDENLIELNESGDEPNDNDSDILTLSSKCCNLESTLHSNMTPIMNAR
jgi:hypothetical protein